MRLGKRVADLEARAGDVALAHLSDAECRERLGDVLGQFGPILSENARDAFEAGDWPRLIKELEAMECD